MTRRSVVYAKPAPVIHRLNHVHSHVATSPGNHPVEVAWQWLPGLSAPVTDGSRSSTRRITNGYVKIWFPVSPPAKRVLAAKSRSPIVFVPRDGRGSLKAPVIFGEWIWSVRQVGRDSGFSINTLVVQWDVKRKASRARQVNDPASRKLPVGQHPFPFEGSGNHG